jgi:uncharacterized membrane protein YbhN (UPF0104 family)
VKDEAMTRRSTPHELASSADHEADRLRNGVLWAAALLLLLLAIGLAVPDLRDVLERVATGEPGWLALAVALEVASCLGYVAVVRLVLSKGPAREVRRLAWAEMAFGAVVPVGGAGGLAVGAWAMRAWGISWQRIANRSAVIFLLTSGLNVTVLAIAGFGVALGIGASSQAGIVYGLVPAAVGVTVLAFFALLPRIAAKRTPAGGRGRVARFAARVAAWVGDTGAVALTPSWRLLGAVGYLLFDIAVLWACLRAFGSTPPLLALVLGYQIGYLANLIPIPGGVGVLEGGLLGALLLYGLPAAPTAAAVIMYHAIALWIPTLGGTVGFARLRSAVAAGGRRLEAVVPDRATAPATTAQTQELAA